MTAPILAAALSGTAALLLAGTLGPAAPAQAGPVLCTTTLEAPPNGGTTPVEMTRCGPILTPADLLQRRYYSYRAPFARGVDLTHQVTDLLGIAMGGGDGTRVMGFGFPDQAIVWDGTAVENTTDVLLEDQNAPNLLRTADLLTCYGASLAGTTCAGTPAMAAPGTQPPGSENLMPYAPPASGGWVESRRGLW